ncbi:three-Cys-motif partner protein TcmP [Amycolatopsis sp. NPDC047767]|uniref:three-Cys-motif partner protein TcmP n=1 Tax=Amycolatopsis sp. NPDC047767 TaxID=3156765 RepID=UPI003451C83F
MTLEGESADPDILSTGLDDYAISGEAGGDEVAGSDDPFFVSKKAAAVFKHKLLKTYFPKFAGKTASTEADKRLAYVDTHAGRGAYDDGTAGSPLLVAQDVAGLRQSRQIDCFFIEAKKSNYERLTQVLANNMPAEARWHVRHGRASDHLREAVDFAGNAPLFMFIDPYGLGPTFDEVVAVLNRPREGHGSKTEVLLNFIAMAFSRAGGYLRLTDPTPQQTTTLEHLDAVLGGDWWHDIYLSSDTTATAVAEIAKGYADRINKKTGCAWTLMPVRDRAHKQPIYRLVHFTRHPDGLWEIREAAAQAGAAWRKYCSPPPASDEGSLFTLEDPFPAEEEARQAGWIDAIEHNARELLARRGEIVLPRDAHEVFGPETFGQAWLKHLRQALVRLFKEGILEPKPLARELSKYRGHAVQPDSLRRSKAVEVLPPQV